MSDGATTAPLDGVVIDLLVASQQAAAACQAWVGRGDKEAADDAAVAAMRQALSSAGGLLGRDQEVEDHAVERRSGGTLRAAGHAGSWLAS